MHNQNNPQPIKPSLILGNLFNGAVSLIASSAERALNYTVKTITAPILFNAVRGNKITLLKAFIKMKADLSMTGANGETALHLAANEGHLFVVDIIINAGADIDALNNNQETPLHLAAKNGHSRILDTLLTWNANVNLINNTGQSALHLACEQGDLGIVNKLIDENINVNTTDGFGYTPLHVAAQHGHRPVVTALVAEGADLDARTRRGETPLFLAAKHHQLPIVLEIEYKTRLKQHHELQLKANPDAITPALVRFVGTFTNKPKNSEQCEQYNIERDEFTSPISFGIMDTPVKLDGVKYDLCDLKSLIKNGNGKRKAPHSRDEFMMTEVQADRETQQAIEAEIAAAAKRATAEPSETELEESAPEGPPRKKQKRPTVV